jgi:NYN domain
MKKHLRNRTHVLVDIENMCGSGQFTRAEATAARTMIESAVTLPDNAQVTVGTTSDEACVEAWLAWSGPRPVRRHGQDGADLALADVALNENLIDRFDHVVICSGDGLFAIVAQYLRAHGVRVTVVCRPGSLSRALASHSDEVVYLSALGRAA